MECVEETLGYELPSGWTFTTIGVICSLQAGKFVSASDISPVCLDNMYPCYGGNGIRGYVEHYTLDGDYPIIGRQGALCGNVNMAHGKFYATEHAVVVTPMIDIDLDWLYHILVGLNLNQYAAGVAQPGLAVSNVLKVKLPLPPANEQKRIAEAVDDALVHIEKLNEAKNDFSSIIALIKSKILDLAIRGKLVPQNPNDESASVLLERIRAEKEDLIRQGKIKRDKKESVIFKGEDNSYYENLPPSWTLATLGMISKLVTKGTTPRGGNVAYSDSGIGFLRAENIKGYDQLSLENLKYVDEETHHDFLKRSILQSGDILITIAGTLGRTAIVTADDLPLNTNQAVAIVRPISTELINIKYVVYALNAEFVSKALLHQEVAMAIPNLSLENISACSIPIPPIKEQQRIVEFIENAFQSIDSIEL